MAYLRPGEASRRAGEQGAAVPNVNAMTSAVAAGATPTKAEFDALHADAVHIRTRLVELLAQVRAAGVIAS
jgi:hypothetical protein